MKSLLKTIAITAVLCCIVESTAGASMPVPQKKEASPEQKRRADSLFRARKAREVSRQIKRDIAEGITLNNLKQKGGASRTLAESYKSITYKFNEVKRKDPRNVTAEDLYEILCEPLNLEYKTQEQINMFKRHQREVDNYLESLTMEQKNILYNKAYKDWERKDTKAVRSKAQFQKVVGKYIKNSGANYDNFYRRDFNQVSREVEQAKGAPLTQQESSALRSSYSSAQQDVKAEHQARGPVNILKDKWKDCDGCTKVESI